VIERDNRQKLRRWFIVIGGCSIALVVLWSLRSSSDIEPSTRRDRTAGATPQIARASNTGTGDERGAADDMPLPVSVIPADGVGDPASRAAATAKLDQTIRHYRATMVYPLWSRPADRSNDHITNWNRSISVGQPFAMNRAKREISATAQIDRVFAPSGTAIAVHVSASYVADGTPAPLDQIDAHVQWRDRQDNRWVTVQAVPLQAASDGWNGAVVPSQIPALREVVREARVVASVRAGHLARELALDFAYAVELPVVVHGIASDRVIDGQLELGLDVELAGTAPVRLMATLFSGDGRTAIAVLDDRFVPAAAGRQVLGVRVFGKILHDRQIDGPYRLGAVHGYVYRKNAMPDQLMFDRADAPAMMTAAHAANEFSAADFKSPEIAAQIARYEALGKALGEGAPPSPEQRGRP
jgi:hypothetical protein